MTRPETEKRLQQIIDEFADWNSKNQGLDSKHFRLVYEQALMEAALKHGIDPESVWFYHEIEDGKGQPF